MTLEPLRKIRRQRHDDRRPYEHPVIVWVVAALALALTASSAGLASGAVKPRAQASSAAAAPHRAPAKRGAPRQLSPADGARVAAVPSFSWAPVRGAAKYEFQLSADREFKSIVAQGAGFAQVANRFATVDKTLADGTYHWRVRAIDRRGRAGRWSRVRAVLKSWGTRPALLSPGNGAAVTFPRTPLVLRWAAVPYAYKYLVTIATDPSLANSALPRTPSVETSATAFALPGTLAPGRYYWAVTPLDSDKHPGARSAAGSFDWVWPSATTARVADLSGDPRVFDPQFSWDAVPGAAQYQVEVSPSGDFAVGSRVCCDDAVIGTSLSPRKLLPNNNYYWRVRAIDVDGNAGVWSVGPTFHKGFDDVVPTIPNLRVRDNVADRQPATGVSGLPTTDAPVIAWDPVAGASSYEVNVAPWDRTFATPFCNWTVADRTATWTSTTATTAWSPLAPAWGGGRPVGNAFATVTSDAGRSLRTGTSYCVRVRARSDRDAAQHEVVSDWTQIGGAGRPAFTYQQHDVPPAGCGPKAMPASAYREPQSGTATSRMPLFTWDWVTGACGYYVVVARDPAFTDVVDVALTTQPSYAPRDAGQPKTYPDETTLYYWAVMPTATATGGGLSTQATEDAPQAFHKRSAPPAPIGPAEGADVVGQASFRWTAAEGAREYRIQVDNDPTFGSPLDDVVTNATAYTSTAAYPADTVLYWRVRANDENRVGLTWSPTGTLRKRLPVPALSPENPLGGEAIPVLAWSPVPGAVSYDLHVEQADGTKRDFAMRSSAFTPTAFYGTGIWRWQVRASFKAGLQATAGGYSGALPFARRIATPTGARTTKAPHAALLAWNPAPQAREYRVQISDSDSFSTVIESATTKNTSYAPAMAHPAFRAGGPLYWRVATVDEGGNIGGWATSALQQGRRMRLRATGRLVRGRSRTARVKVTDARGHAIAGVLVRVTGQGLRVRARRTGRRGSVAFRIRASRRGPVTLRAEKRGYAPAAVTLRVR